MPALLELELQIPSVIEMLGFISRAFVSTLPPVATHRRCISCTSGTCAACVRRAIRRLIAKIIDDNCVRSGLGSTKGLHSSEPAEPAEAN